MTVSTVKLFRSSTVIALKFKFSILTFFAVVWLPKSTIPALSKCEAICAGPVSFEMINLALLIRDTKALILIGWSLSKTTLAFSSLASSISSGPGANRIGYLFL